MTARIHYSPTDDAPSIGDVHCPRPGSRCIGRVVVDHVIRGVVYAHDVWAARPFAVGLADFIERYERDASWCDGTMASLVHPGMDGDGI